MRPSRWAIGLALLLGCSPAQQAPGQERDYLQITFLDVGQADAILIRAPEGQTALVDAGEGAPLSALAALGVTGLDLLVASHPHDDHIGGMVGVVEALPVRFFMDNGVPHTTATYRELVRALERRPEIRYLEAQPRRIQLGSSEIEVLPLPPPGDANLNNRSVSLVVRYGAFALLLTGDSQGPQLGFLVEAGLVPDVTVLKAPHHGSDNGLTWEFLEAARPQVLVISVGANGYGHPGLAALEAYAAVSEGVYRTDVDGEVTIRGYEDGSYEVYVARGPE
ncbi:MAG: MBL fold metallo-hydrolase [Longimicrobiales bacterium]|nr:MBL fold metallo-hydrolase [Longimicrobiales bacterium]